MPPTPAVSHDYTVRQIREVTQGVTPAGSMTVIPFATFDPTGGDVKRAKAKNTVGDGQVVANIATDMETPAAAASSDLLHTHYTPLWEELLGAAAAAGLTYTGTNVTAVVSGNVLRLTSGVWPGFVVGDRVYITGLVTNGAAFIGRVTANAGTDLSLDIAYKTLLAEAAGPSVTVAYLSRLRAGNTLLTSTYEMFNANASTGEVLRGAGAHNLVAKFTVPNAPEMTWQILGWSTAAITAALANATIAAAAQYPFDSNVGFGAQLLIGGGGGLFYSGALYPNVRIQDLTVTFSYPRKVSGGAGSFGPLVSFRDDIMDIKINIKICNDHADARALLADARNTSILASIGWAWRDPNGGLEYWYFGALDPSKGKRDGVKQQGEDMIEFEWMARKHAVHSMFERTLFN